VEESLGVDVSPDFWQPAEDEFELLPAPELIFAQGRKVSAPAAPRAADYRRYYTERLERLRRGGVYRFEPTVPRKIHLVTPAASGGWPDALQQAFRADLKAALDNLVGSPFTLVPVRADDPDEVGARLSAVSSPGTAVVVFDDRTSPAAHTPTPRPPSSSARSGPESGRTTRPAGDPGPHRRA
jgi:hypothetical protein